MCHIADWYKTVLKLEPADACSAMIHKIIRLSNVGDGETLKQISALPWEEQSVLVRISVMRSLWHVTRVADFQDHYVNLRTRVHASLSNELGKDRADHLLRGLFDPQFNKPFAEKMYATSEDESEGSIRG